LKSWEGKIKRGNKMKNGDERPEEGVMSNRPWCGFVGNQNHSVETKGLNPV